MVLQQAASFLARFPGVKWVGRRPARHKISKYLGGKVGRETSWSASLKRLLWWAVRPAYNQSDCLPRLALVALVPPPQRFGDFAENFVACNATDLISDWNSQWRSEGFSAELSYVSEDKALLFAGCPGDFAEATSWLAERHEVLWIEPKTSFAPHNAASKRMLTNGPELANLDIADTGGSNPTLSL